jgi:hypothetical protein
MLVKMCTTTCIFVFFPIISTYFLIAERSLLFGYPSYIVRRQRVNKQSCTDEKGRFSSWRLDEGLVTIQSILQNVNRLSDLDVSLTVHHSTAVW